MHNTRIERLWRDVYSQVTSTYRVVFDTLELEGVLDPINVVDLFCLHYIYVPRINEALQQFQDAWNNHSLSTESNRTPLQLYTLYSIGNPLFSDDSHVDTSQYGIDSQSDVEEVKESETVDVPETDIPLSDASYSSLCSIIDPLHQSSCYGVDLYLQTVRLVYQLMIEDNLYD